MQQKRYQRFRLGDKKRIGDACQAEDFLGVPRILHINMATANSIALSQPRSCVEPVEQH